MSTERDAGYAALQQGDIARAVSLLETACTAEPGDFLSHLYLGAAYGRAGRSMDAVQTMTRAVQLQPANPQARYNLAIALDGGGWKTQALEAAQQAVQLQPDYPSAQELIRNLSTPDGQVPIAPIEAAAAEAPTPAPDPDTTTAFAAASDVASSVTQAPEATSAFPAAHVPPMEPTTVMPPSIPAFGASASSMPAYGAPTQAMQAGGAPYPNQGAAAYGGPPAQPTPYYAAPVAYMEDRFDLRQAFRDIPRVIRAPHAFFQEQVGKEGLNAPIAFIVAVVLVSAIAQIIGLVRQTFTSSVGALQGVFGIVFLPITLAIFIGVYVVGALIWAGIVHLTSMLFGNRAGYAAAFRAVAYSIAPLLIFMLINALVTPFLPGPTTVFSRSTTTSGQIILAQAQSVPSGSSRTTVGGSYGSRRSSRAVNPFAGANMGQAMERATVSLAVMSVGMLWVWTLQAIGLRHLQGISRGGAAASVLIPVVLFSLLVWGVAAMFMSMISSFMPGGSR